MAVIYPQFDAAGRQGGVMGTVLSMPSIQQQFTDQIFGSDADLVEYQPSPASPLRRRRVTSRGWTPCLITSRGRRRLTL
jgi:hypothetical protein